MELQLVHAAIRKSDVVYNGLGSITALPVHEYHCSKPEEGTKREVVMLSIGNDDLIVVVVSVVVDDVVPSVATNSTHTFQHMEMLHVFTIAV